MITYSWNLSKSEKDTLTFACKQCGIPIVSIPDLFIPHLRSSQANFMMDLLTTDHISSDEVKVLRQVLAIAILETHRKPIFREQCRGLVKFYHSTALLKPIHFSFVTNGLRVRR